MLNLDAERPSAALVPAAGADAAALPWIRVAPGAPYFMTEAGEAWTPVGHNDAITWPTLRGLFRRKDLAGVEAYLRRMAASGVTCLRVMLEYAQVKHRYLERPVGTFVPAMVRLWDDVIRLCEATGIRLLLTPVDTFWTWLKWEHHPYNRRNGGPLDHPSRMLLCKATRDAVKARLSFAVRRWSGSGAVFAWDLWNEIHPAQAEDSADAFGEFIHDLSSHVRQEERRLFGRAHPQTVSLFGPELRWRSHMPLRDPIFRHPDLDVCSIHIYEEGAIDDPKDTVGAAVATGRIVRDAIAEITDARPFFDSEHGPIHTFKDRRRTLPAAFDDEYFRHMQWAHLASGGAGGGMRWPNRSPHVLTPGMHRAQHAMAGFLPLVDWVHFRRACLNDKVEVTGGDVAAFACGDLRQALVWLLRRDSIGRDGRLRRDVPPVAVRLRVPGLDSGAARVTYWDTREGHVAASETVTVGEGGAVLFPPPLLADHAIAIGRD